MTDIEFTEWPKIPRLNRPITVTEKLDGTNGAIGIILAGGPDWTGIEEPPANVITSARIGDQIFHVYAQSRKTIITPDADNHGFAKWVHDNATALIPVLGEGLHFGEWWGSGIQRGYGLVKGEKRFSLFNTSRWDFGKGSPVEGLYSVPVLYEGPFMDEEDSVFASQSPWKEALYELEYHGSAASPGFMDPEGVVIYHHAANHCFKVTIRGDEAPKGSNG